MSTEVNKKIIIKWFETFNTNDLIALEKVAEEVWAPDCTFRDVGMKPGIGPAYINQFLRGFFGNVSEAHIEIGDVIAEGDKGVCRYTVFSTNKSTGKQEIIEVMFISRFSGGKIVDVWQLGVSIPAPIMA